METAEGRRLIELYLDEEIDRQMFHMRIMGIDPMKIEYYRRHVNRGIGGDDADHIEPDDVDDFDEMKKYLSKQHE